MLPTELLRYTIRIISTHASLLGRLDLLYAYVVWGIFHFRENIGGSAAVLLGGYIPPGFAPMLLSFLCFGMQAGGIYLACKVVGLDIFVTLERFLFLSK